MYAVQYGMRTLFLIALFAAVHVAADPEVTVTAYPRKGGREILFYVLQTHLTEMEGCHYNFFAADDEDDLNEFPGRAISIATFFQYKEELYIFSFNLQQLNRNKLGSNTATVYFRMIMSCNGGATHYYGDIFPLEFTTSKKGTVNSVRRLILRMKHHMRWAEEKDFL